MQQEYEYIDRMKQEKEDIRNRKIGTAQIEMMDEQDRVALLRDLKHRWNQMNNAYQLITHHVYLDTMLKVKQKEYYEAQLAQLEKDIEKMSKKYVFIRRR